MEDDKMNGPTGSRSDGGSKSVIITEIFVLPSSCLGPNFMEFVTDEVIKTRSGMITKRHGIICDVSREMVILSNKITSDGSVAFEVQFKALTIKPVVGCRYKGEKVMFRSDKNMFISTKYFSVMVTANGAHEEEEDQILAKDILVKTVEFKNGKFVVIGTLEAPSNYLNLNM